MELKRAFACAVLLSAVAASLFAQIPTATTTWVDSPEAIFLTSEERAEWWTLDSDAERELFKERYWAQRDPTPDTPKNEFKEIIANRIAIANQRFPIENTPGSQTARGFVFILLGTPAHVQDVTGDSGPAGQPPGWIGSDRNEVGVTWTYDKLRTPKTLEMLGRPELTVSFLIQPSRRRDQLLNPGLINGIRDTLAARSIARRIPLSSIRKVDFTLDALPGPALGADAGSQLDQVAASTAAPLQWASVWNADGSPLTLFWLVTPEPAPGMPPTLLGRIRDAEEHQVAALNRTARAAAGFSLNSHGIVLASRLALPPGSYSAAFLAQQAGISKPLGTANGRLVVPPAGPGPAMSSLLLTDGLAGVTPDGAALAIGPGIRPRADSRFRSDESLWYAFEVLNPTNPAEANLTVTLRRRDAKSIQSTQIPAALQKLSEKLFFGAYELPLTAIAPGDYSLYVTLTDGEAEQVRRADFTVLPGSAVR